MRLVAAAGRAHGHIAGAERAALRAQRRGEGALAAAGDDVDDAAHGVGAVEAAHGAADHLDALDVLGGKIGEIELAVGGVVGLDAVDQHQRLVALGAADAHLREIAEAAAAVDGDAGQAAQRLGGMPHLLGAQLLAGDDRDRIADGVAGNAGDRALGAIGRHALAGSSGSRARALGRRAGGGLRRSERGALHDNARQNGLRKDRRGQQRQTGQPCRDQA